MPGLGAQRHCYKQVTVVDVEGAPFCSPLSPAPAWASLLERAAEEGRGHLALARGGAGLNMSTPGLGGEKCLL